jgi:hypothetical protein
MIIYNPNLVAPRKGFHDWMDKNYPKSESVLVHKKDLVSFLNSPFGHKGAWISRMATETIPKMNKKRNPYFWTLKKVQTSLIMGGWNYENAVNSARERLLKLNDGPIFDDEIGWIPPSGPFKSSERRNGVRKGSIVIIENSNGGQKLYFEVRILDIINIKYFNDGIEVDENEVSRYLRDQVPNYKAQGLAKKEEVVLKDYGFDTLRKFVYTGRNINIEV